MFDIIIDFIIQKQNDIGILALSILGILYISTLVIFKKFPIVETLILLISVGLAVFVWYITRNLVVTLLNINLIVWAIAVLVLACILVFIVILIRALNFKHRMRFYELTPSNIESNIYAYFDKKSHLLMFTEQFYNIVPKTYKKKKKWYKTVQKIICDGEEMTYKRFLSHLKGFGEKSFNIEIIFNEFTSIKEEVIKSMVTEDGKVRGYVLYNQKLTPAQVYKDSIIKEYATHLYNFFDSMNEPIAYFDIYNNGYVLTDSMKKLLGVEINNLPSELLLSYVVEEDMGIYKKMLLQAEGSNIYYYRLKTVNGIEWFEETRTFEGIYVYNIIHRANFIPRQIKYLTRENLETDIRVVLEASKPFTLVFITLKKVALYAEKMGKDVANVLVDRYFSKLMSNNGNQLRIYKLANADFCLIFTGNLDYERIVSDINSNTSDLMNFDIIFNGNKYQMNNALGIVKSESVSNPSSERFIVAGYEALNLANNTEYNKQFSIYREKKENRNSYQYDNYRVDINNEFLYDKRKI
ncbi:MAG: hypothetical protein PHO86_02005 [Bacilli bacterium]|nr:hypothetical protein [Bacilli bacterium]